MIASLAAAAAEVPSPVTTSPMTINVNELHQNVATVVYNVSMYLSTASALMMFQAAI